MLEAPALAEVRSGGGRGWGRLGELVAAGEEFVYVNMDMDVYICIYICIYIYIITYLYIYNYICIWIWGFMALFFTHISQYGAIC